MGAFLASIDYHNEVTSIRFSHRLRNVINRRINRSQLVSESLLDAVKVLVVRLDRTIVLDSDEKEGRAPNGR